MTNVSEWIRVRRDKHIVIPTLVWITLSLLLVRQVLVYGTRVPLGEDWMMLRLLRPELPFHAPEPGWLFDQPFPLAKWTYVVLVGGFHDTRAGTWLTVLLLVASAWACMHAARALRGRAHLTDAFFPLVLLHGAHSANTLSSIQVGYALFTALTLLGLLIAATIDETPSAKRIAAIGLVGAATPLTWSGGLPHGFFWCVALVVLWRAARRSGETKHRRTGKIALACAVVIAVITIAESIAYFPPPELEGTLPRLYLTAALRFFSRGMGESAVLFRPIGSLIVVGASASALYILVRSAFVSNTARVRAIGVLLVLAALGTTAFMVGWRRVVEGHASGLGERYGLVAAPLWCALGITAALAWGLRAARILAWFLFILSGLCLLPNFLAGEREGLARRAFVRALEKDLSNELTIDEIVAARWLEARLSPTGFTDALRDFEALRMGPFDGGDFRRVKLRPAPPFECFLSEPQRYNPEPSDVIAGEADGQRVLFVRDGKPLDFVIGPDPCLVRGSFGMHADVEGSKAGPRARFEVLLVRLDGTSNVLFARLLDPAEVPADRGEQRFRQRLDPSAANGTVVLRVVHEEGSRDSLAGYWREVLVR